jgi:glutamyl-tRNA reductase
MDWFTSLGVVPTITAIRQQLEQFREQELEHLFRRVELDEHERELVIKMSHRLVNKILHEPTTRLKKEAANGNGPAYTSTLRHLFALEQANKEGQ